MGCEVIYLSHLEPGREERFDTSGKEGLLRPVREAAES